MSTGERQSRDSDGPVGDDVGETAHASQEVVAALAAREDATVAAVRAQQALEPRALADQAAFIADRAALDAAGKTADAARSARASRAAAATLAAASVAEAAARTVEAVQIHADELAVAVATAAAEAAVTVSNSVTTAGDAEASRAALLVGATVISAAAAKAEETARAAVLVARAVAAAAAAVAATTAAEAAAMEDKVFDAAVAIQATTIATAKQLASDTLARAEAVATADRASAAAAERLRQANLELQRASRHDRSVALALQEAMLTQLPERADLELAARYLTAAERDQVGGDWYDALVLPAGTTFVIGDVVGHDIAAAATMGQLRNILRALIWERNKTPSDVVRRLDRAMLDLGIHTLATMIMVNVDPPATGDSTGANRLRWTNAGHPAPILIAADGSAALLDDTTDVLLGVRPDTLRRDQSAEISGGDTLLLYTDGLVETRGNSIAHGQDRLLDVVRAHYRLSPGGLLDAVLAEMVSNRPDDDVALLAARFHM